MSFIQELREYLVTQGLAPYQAVTAARIPENGLVDIADGQWGLYQQPGSKIGGNFSIPIDRRNIVILYRAANAIDIYDSEDGLMTILNGCVSLPGYKVIRITAGTGGQLPVGQKDTHVMQLSVIIDTIDK